MVILHKEANVPLHFICIFNTMYNFLHCIPNADLLPCWSVSNWSTSSYLIIFSSVSGIIYHNHNIPNEYLLNDSILYVITPDLIINSSTMSLIYSKGFTICLGLQWKVKLLYQTGGSMISQHL